MKQHLNAWLTVLLIAGLVLVGSGAVTGCSPKPDDEEISRPEVEAEAEPESSTPDPDVPYVPTPQHVVERMLEMAEVTENDVVYDLGSGDGRIVITAAREYGARGVGVEIDPQRVEIARENAENAGVADLVEFRQGDLFEADISDATVVTLYLLPSVNIKLRPKLLEELDPGARVVSHDFDMDEWEPDETETLGSDTIYLWTIPEDTTKDFTE